MDTARFRSTVYDLLHAHEIETRAQEWVRLAIAGIILLSLFLVVVVSVPRIERTYGGLIDAAEAFVIIAFASEYLLRLWCVTNDPKFAHPVFGRLRYFITAMALVDLLAIAPVAFPDLLPFNLTFIRSARLIVLLRVAKLGHYSHSLNMISRVIRAKRHEIGAALFVIMLLIVCASIIMYYLERDSPHPAFASVPAAFWWAIATVTTVNGYSSAFPHGDLGRICAIAISLLGVTAFALPSGIIVTGLLEEYQHRERLCSRCHEKLAGEVKSPVEEPI